MNNSSFLFNGKIQLIFQELFWNEHDNDTGLCLAKNVLDRKADFRA